MATAQNTLVLHKHHLGPHEATIIDDSQPDQWPFQFQKLADGWRFSCAEPTDPAALDHPYYEGDWPGLLGARQHAAATGHTHVEFSSAGEVLFALPVYDWTIPLENVLRWGPPVPLHHPHAPCECPSGPTGAPSYACPVHGGRKANRAGEG